MENAFTETFNGRLGDRLLNVEIFLDQTDSSRILRPGRTAYTRMRPHRALADRTPEEFAVESRVQSLRLFPLHDFREKLS